MDNSERINLLKSLLCQRIMVVDGAMGTSIQGKELGPEDFGGEEFEGCNEYLTLTRPDVILDIHQGYLAAGADILETNTFGATSVVLAEYNLAHEALRLNLVSAQLARQASDAASTPDKPRFVAGSMGPTTKTISVTGGVTFDELSEAYREQAVGLVQGGADLLLLETTQDTINVKAGLIGIDKAFEELGCQIPVAIQGTIEPMGTLLAGQDAEAFYTSLAHRDLLWIGFNCATGPDFMTDHIRTLSGLSPLSRRLPAQRRPSRRGWQVQRDPGDAGNCPRPLYRKRLGERDWRLLRHRPGAHPLAGRKSRRRNPPGTGAAAGVTRLRH